MFESIQPAIQEFIITVVTGILGLLSAFLIALVKKGFDWLNEKVNAIKDSRAQNALNNALVNLQEIVSTTVISLQQTLGDDIKASIASGDGQYSKEDLLELKDKALESVKSQLTDSTKEVLSTVYSDLDSFISDLIETKVRDLKSSVSSFLDVSADKILLG